MLYFSLCYFYVNCSVLSCVCQLFIKEFHDDDDDDDECMDSENIPAYGCSPYWNNSTISTANDQTSDLTVYLRESIISGAAHNSGSTTSVYDKAVTDRSRRMRTNILLALLSKL